MAPVGEEAKTVSGLCFRGYDHRTSAYDPEPSSEFNDRSGWCFVRDSWVAVDFETANSFRGSPCAVGMVAVEDGQLTGRFSTLIRPPAEYGHFDRFNVAIHGITPDHVANAPTWSETYAAMLDFAAGRPLVAHNAAFDMSVLKAACTAERLAWPDLSYACSLVTARRTWQLLSYRLDHVAAAAGVELTNHHEALADAEAAARIMITIHDAHQVDSLKALLGKLRINVGRLR
jgi:DNA polymerase-3 subunit epsilon